MLTKVVIGILAAAVLGTGGYKYYDYVSANGCPLGGCGSKPETVSTTPAEPCVLGCCGETDFNTAEPPREVLSVMPREVN